MPLILPLNYPDSDGEQFSRTSITLSAIATATRGTTTTQIAAAQRIDGWVSWKYKRSLKPGKGYNNKAAPQIRTRGKAEFSSTLVLLAAQWVILEDYLYTVGAAKNRGPWEQSFQLTATAFEQSMGSVRWDAVGCRVMDDDGGPDKESDEPLESTVELDVMNIFRDGRGIVRENTPFGQAGVILTF
jgi:hypothetical protein